MNSLSSIRIFKIAMIMFTISFSVLALTNYSANSYSSQENLCWSHAKSMPTARIETAGVVLDEQIYILGGNTQPRPTDLVQVFDPVADQWRTAPPLPEKLDHLAAAVHDGKIYVVGGYTEETAPSNKLFIYDPATEEWKSGANMPTARGALSADFIEGILYVIGGDGDPSTNEGRYDPSGQVSVNEAYNPETDLWTERSPMPTSRHHHVSAVIDGKLYVIGGRQGISPLTFNFNNTNANEMYDPKKNIWVSLEPMPTNRSGASAASVNGNIYVLGGETKNWPAEAPHHTFNTNEKYDPAVNKWILEPGMPTPRHGLSALAINNTIYAIGGGKESGSSKGNANELFNADRTESCT